MTDGHGNEIPVIGTRPDGSVSGWNDAARALYGYTAAEIIGKPLNLIYPASPITSKGMVAKLAMEGECIEGVAAIHRTKTGRFVKVSLCFMPLKDDSGHVAGVSMIVREVGAPGDWLRSADENQLWTWAVVESAVDGIVTINEHGIMEYANPAALRMFGYEHGEVLGKNVSLLMPSPYREEHDAYLANYLRTGVKKIIGIGREVQARRKDGSVFPVQLAVSEVKIGERRIFTGIIHDISELKRSQNEKDQLLKELNRRNRQVSCLYSVAEAARAGALDDTMFRRAVDSIQSAIAQPFVSGTRLTFDGKRMDSLSCQETPWKLAADISAQGRKRGNIEVFLLEQPPGTEERRILKEKQALIEAVAQVIGDMVERKEAEAKVFQASKLASIGELAAGVGHEINNPVNSILNCADILISQSEAGSKARQFGEMIHSEAERIAAIVHNLLAFSRQDKDEFSAARLYDIVEGVLNLCRKKLDKSHIDLRVNVPQDLPRLNCRSEQLQQVIMNLIINAMHSLDERYPAAHPDKILAVDAREIHQENGPYIRLTVEDHGMGIRPEHIDRIFDPFFTTKGRDKGTGLGLSISDSIVKDHGGTLTVHSTVGDRTAFYVDLPITRPNESGRRGNV